ncbi:MAG: hypothetical protein H0T46_24180 [Deltaproteobacteria bacterium]|nr:hypothetical protein [Deltaproteobacteria bacterium]
MQSATSVAIWFLIILFVTALAIMFLMSLPSGAMLQIAAHAGLLVGGGMTALSLAPRDPLKL